MTSVSPPFSILGAVLVSVTLGGFFALLVCVLICICRMSHSIPTNDSCDGNLKMRQEGVRSCPEGRLDDVVLSMPTDRSMPAITLTQASIKKRDLSNIF